MNNPIDKTYHQFLEHILASGEKRSDRTGTGTISVFNYQMEFDISESFPLVTTKRVHFPSVAHELLWFISGETNIKYLVENKVRIWTPWADGNGNLGPVYGHQWRRWVTQDGRKIDQLQQLIKNLKNNPFSRRHVLSAWNVGDLDEMALPPCHLLFQFYVTQSGYLHCKLFQRSADAFLGVPFNIASYSLLTYMIASLCNLKPGKFVWSGTDCHIYSDHVDAVATQLERTSFAPPTLTLDKVKDIDSFSYENIHLHNYQYHPTIKAPISV